MRMIIAVAAALCVTSVLLVACSSGTEATTENYGAKPAPRTESVQQPEIDSTYPNKPLTTDLVCVDAVEIAAAVPASEINNDEVYVTLIACETHAEWFTSLRANPQVFGVTAIGADEVSLYTLSACLGAEETAVCADALELGVI